MSCGSRRRVANRTRTTLFAVAPLIVAGCTERLVEGNQSIYQSTSWVGPAQIVFLCLTIVVGCYLRKRLPSFAYPAILVGTFFLLILPGSSYVDRVVIDDDHFEATYGFWFSPNHHDLRFKDLRQIRYTYTIRRRGSKHYELRCLKQSGDIETVHVGDLVTYAVKEILERATAQGVPIIDD